MKKFKRYGGIIVKVGDECLLCKRNEKGSLPGQWSIPAGGLNNGEHPLVGAKREFFEETNQRIDGDVRLVGFVRRTNRDGKKDKGLLYVFKVDSDEKIIPDLGNAKDGDEHTECGYFNLENNPIQDKTDQLYKLIEKILKKD